MRRYNLVLPLAIALLLAAAGSVRAAAPRVVVTIRPVHSLVATVMEGVGTPELLLKSASSPHSYALRPSDVRALEAADLVVWVGPELETFLERPLRALSPRATVLALERAEGVTLLPSREGGTWEPHAQEGEHAGGAAPGHSDEEEHDLHLWLSPANARAIVQALARALSALDPANAPRYARNAAQALEALERLDARLRDRLAPVRDRPFVVFHDAFAYFEAAYGLRAVGSITVTPEQAPGARRISELRAKVLALGAICVFREPQFEPRLVNTIIQGTQARTGTLDDLGAELPEGPGLYALLLERLADNLLDCLAPR